MGRNIQLEKLTNNMILDLINAKILKYDKKTKRFYWVAHITHKNSNEISPWEFLTDIIDIDQT